MNLGRFTQKEIEIILDSLKPYAEKQSNNRDEAYNEGEKEISEHYQQKALDAINLYYDIRSYCKKEFSSDEFAMTEREALRKIVILLLRRNKKCEELFDNKNLNLEEYLDKGQELDSMCISSIWNIIRKYETDNRCSICPIKSE